MKRIFLSSIIALTTLASQAQTLETDSVLRTMKEELNYNMAQLKLKPVPAYFMSLRLTEEQNLTITSALGASEVEVDNERYIIPNIRIGDKELDNYKYDNQGSGGEGGASGASVPITDGPLCAYRDEIWTETMNRYDVAVTNYEDAKNTSQTTAELEDKAPCFSDAPVEKYYEPALPAWTTDTAAWVNKLNKVSNIFKQCRLLDGGQVEMNFLTSRKYLVNTDGTEVVHNRRCMRIVLTAQLNATDGMPCSLVEDFFGFSESEMPSEEVLIAKAKDMVDRLLALREAPLADPYTGPAILSGSASGVFFHEIFGHRLETHRMKTGGQTFQHMVGEKILPQTFNVYCDPTLSYYASRPLNGGYKYDDEGVKAQRVNNVENGILKNFLMGRIPLEGFPQSNGHGRASQGNDPLSRQSNLIVETTKPYTDAQLRQMLIKEAKKQGKEYGYFFRTVMRGYTKTEELNSFNVMPVEVYRVYVDGRKDELVRGVSLIGTPLNMFSNIVSAGDAPETFIGSCGAESGWVPVSASSPEIFVSKIETQRGSTNKMAPRILSLPQYAKDPNINKVEGVDEKNVIFRALEDEMQRTKDSLQIADLPLPYFVDYKLIRGSVYKVSASLGGVYHDDFTPRLSSGYVNLTIGDQMFTNESRLNESGSDVYVMQQMDYDDIRRGYWLISDYLYKASLNQYGQKQDYLNKNPMPEDDLEIPEMLELPAREYIEPTALTENIDTAKLKIIASELSAVYVKYPKIWDSDVHVVANNYDIYRVTSEGQKLRFPCSNLRITSDARIKTPDGEDFVDGINFVVNNMSELPSLDEMKKEMDDFCQLMIKKSEATVIKDYYVGPLLIEDDAVSEAVLENIVRSDCQAERGMTSGSSENSMKVGKHIVDHKMSITQLTDTPEYDGVKLISDYRVDADGVTPAKTMPIIENGVLKTLLTGRRPAINALQSTGNERFVINSTNTANSPGTLLVNVENSIPVSKMRETFLKEARKVGLDYAYIVKAPHNCEPYIIRVDVKSGDEEIVRTQTIPLPIRTEMMHIVAASKEEIVTNIVKGTDNSLHTGVSVIAPRAMIVENVEFSFKKPNRSQELELQNPATR